MSEHTPITGELRGKMDTLGRYDEDGNIVFTTGGTRAWEIACLAINSKTFGELCDAIDAVHAGLERENAELRERLAALDNEGGNMHDGWVLLPLDADGLPIRVGDVMEWPYGNGEFVVEGIGGNTLFYIDKDNNECEWTAAGDKRHYHAPTVEDVLTKFGIDWEYESNCEDRAALLKEYAAKLRLASNEE